MEKYGSKIIITEVKSCARCGGDHREVVFSRFKSQTAEGTHWGMCPDHREPITLFLGSRLEIEERQKKDKEKWAVGQYRGETDIGTVWDFQGIYDTYELALAACINERYFIFRADLNQQLLKDKFTGHAEYPLKLE